MIVDSNVVLAGTWGHAGEYDIPRELNQLTRDVAVLLATGQAIGLGGLLAQNTGRSGYLLAILLHHHE